MGKLSLHETRQRGRASSPTFHQCLWLKGKLGFPRSIPRKAPSLILFIVPISAPLLLPPPEHLGPDGSSSRAESLPWTLPGSFQSHPLRLHPGHYITSESLGVELFQMLGAETTGLVEGKPTSGLESQCTWVSVSPMLFCRC